MNLVEIRVKGSKKFTLGIDSEKVIKTEVRLPRDWMISDSNISCGDWEEVRLWGLNNGYELCEIDATDPLLPVTMVNWFDCALFCNAKSEMEGLDPAYTIDGELVSGSQEVQKNKNKIDMGRFRVIKDASGYRLPTEVQWEYCATNGGNITPEEYMSHQYSNIPCFDSNCTYCTHKTWVPDRRNPEEGKWIGDLEQIYSRDPSATGLYHMTGNTLEWVFDDFSDVAYETDGDGEDPDFNEDHGRFEKTLKSSAYIRINPDMHASDRYCCNATFRMQHVSFRIVKPIL